MNAQNACKARRRFGWGHRPNRAKNARAEVGCRPGVKACRGERTQRVTEREEKWGKIVLKKK